MFISKATFASSLCVFIMFLLSNNLCAQVSKTTVAQEDTMDIVQERNQIPGKTMGQKLESLLFWTQEDKERRFPMMHAIYPSHQVMTGSDVFQLKKGKTLHPKWTDQSTLESYIEKNHIGGVLVLQNDKILLEAYGEHTTDTTVWTSFSVAKSVSSMLLGAALKDGSIESMEDPLEKYIPELKYEDYGKVTVRQLLTMTSGIAWNEDYADENSDVAQMYQAECEGNEAHILTYMKSLKFKHNPGSRWNYSTGETDLLGILIQKATGKNLAEYLSEKIWKPWGMESQAYWLADECSNLSIGGSGISATLRDYGRIGSLMLHQGKRDGENLLAEEWVQDATSLLIKTGEDNSGYGYLWWLDKEGNYMAVGIFGQMVYINPEKNLVIAQFAAWPKAASKTLSRNRQEFIKAVERGL